MHGTSVKLWTSSFGFRTTKFFQMVVRKLSESLFLFSLLFCNRRRVGLTVFFMGAILYALFLAVFSHYLYCGHYFMANNSNFFNEITHNYDVFEVSETDKTTAIIARFFQFLVISGSAGAIPHQGRGRGGMELSQFLPLNMKAKHFSRNSIAVFNLINTILSKCLTLAPF